MVLERALTIEEICNKLRPIFGKKIDEIYFRYTVADGREEQEDIAHILEALYQKNLKLLLDKGVLLEPPREEIIDGDYNLATISYAGKKLYPFTLREKDWQRHICITGMSGSGKTTFAFQIIEELNKKNKKFLIFDWKKSFRPLLAEIPDLLAFTVGDERTTNLFKTNINRPPKGVAPKEWIITLADMLTESFLASFGVHKVLLETLDEAFKEWGIYNGSDNFPTWNHIKWRLEEKLKKNTGNSREGGWLESCLRIATVLTFGEFGKTLNYKGDNAISVEDILNKKVLMELNSLGNVEKKFFCEYLLTYIYKLKKARQNVFDAKFDHAILVDEAHNIFLKKPTNFSNESVTDMIYREMREYGTSLICLDQHISKISDTVKGNSACTIAFQQQLPEDIEDISAIMQLREKRHFFPQLKVGTAIVKLSERYTQPFLVDVPFSETRKKRVTNEEVKKRMKAVIMNNDFEKDIDPVFNKTIKTPDEVPTIFHIVDGKTVQGPNSKISGDHSHIYGDATNITGDPTRILGDVSNLSGDVTDLLGDVSNLKGTIGSLTGDIAGLKGDVSHLEGDIEEIKELNRRKKLETSEVQNQEKKDKEFLTELDKREKESTIKKIEIKEIEPPVKENKKVLPEVQQLIHQFVKEHLDAGQDLNTIEQTLEQSKSQGNYTTNDIIRVINNFFNHSIMTTLKKEENLTNEHLNGDQQIFVEFLQKNPNHMLSTVEVYREIELSARKGTKIKKELEEKNLIRIEEIKYDKGWKKLIRLA
jgi:hypothetical protein